MPVKVNNKYIVPAPLVTFSKTNTILPNGDKIGSVFNVSMNGFLIPNKGNPVGNSGTATFSTDSWTSSYGDGDDPVSSNQPVDFLLTTINKQEAIRDLFSSGALVEILGYNSTRGLRFYGIVENINCDSQGNWALPCPYSISLRTYSFLDSAAGLFADNSTEDGYQYYISDVQEDWSISEADQVTINSGDYTQVHKLYNISHNVTAVGSPVYDSSGNYLNGLAPWQQASGYVRSLNFGNNVPQNIMLPSTYGLANQRITEAINKNAGTYSLQETFTFYDSGLLPYPVIETVAVSEDIGEDGLTNVSIQGTIAGMETVNPLGTGNYVVQKFNNAENYFNTASNIIYNRAKQISGLSWLHPLYLTASVSKDIATGTISYSRVFNNRPPNLIPNSRTENIEISDTYPGQLVAIIPVIGRSQPVLQYLNSRSEYRRTLSIQVTLNPITQNWSASGVNSSGYWVDQTQSGIRNWLIYQKPSVVNTAAFSGIYEAANPANDGATSGRCYYEAPQENWNPKTNSYSYSVSWIYEKA